MGRVAYLLLFQPSGGEVVPMGLFDDLENAMHYAMLASYRVSVAANEGAEAPRWAIEPDGSIRSSLPDGQFAIHEVQYRRSIF